MTKGPKRFHQLIVARRFGRRVDPNLQAQGFELWCSVQAAYRNIKSGYHRILLGEAVFLRCPKGTDIQLSAADVCEGSKRFKLLKTMEAGTSRSRAASEIVLVLDSTSLSIVGRPCVDDQFHRG